MPGERSELLTPADVGHRAGLSERTVRRAIGAGELRAYRLRGRYRIRPEDLDEWLDVSVVGTADLEPRPRVRPAPAPATTTTFRSKLASVDGGCGA